MMRAAAALATAIAALLLAACVRLVRRRGAAPEQGGTLIDAEDQAPPILNVLLADGISTVAPSASSRTSSRTCSPSTETGPYVPQLAEAVPSGEDVREGPLRVTFHLRPEARWSDGAPVTSADVVFTWRTMMDPAQPDREPRRAGTRSRASTPGRTAAGGTCAPATCFTVAFRGDYAPWRDVFSVVRRLLRAAAARPEGQGLQHGLEHRRHRRLGPVHPARASSRGCGRCWRATPTTGARRPPGGGPVPRPHRDQLPRLPRRGGQRAAPGRGPDGEPAARPRAHRARRRHRRRRGAGRALALLRAHRPQHPGRAARRPRACARRWRTRSTAQQVVDVLLDGSVPVLQSVLRPFQLGYAPAFERLRVRPRARALAC